MTQTLDRIVRPRRSLLFVPGLRPDRFAKALEAGADIVCVDMEDAVARDRKDEGRALTLPLFRDKTHPRVEQMVRINGLSTPDGLKDLTALIESDAPPPSIMIPKVKSAEEIHLIETLLSAGPAREIRFCVIIETNQGLERAIEIAKSSARIDSIILGAVDMSADLRCEKSWEPLLYARSRLVHAAASAGIANASREALIADPKVIEMIEHAISSLSNDFAQYEKIKKITLLPHEFTIDAGELTPTLKVKRRVVEAKYKDLIDRMYA